MAHRCANKLRLASSSRLTHARHVHSTPPCLDALAVPFAEYSTALSPPSTSSRPRPKKTPLDAVRAQKLASIREVLSLQSPSPNRVWANYMELLQHCGTDQVPLDIHQSVLRKCAPPAKHVRALWARRRAAGIRYKDDAMYESRYQSIIRNMRSSGHVPALDDYHCVLELFAAVGNHETAMLVLREVGRMGLVKEPKTYGLCLQALWRRMTLPVWHEARKALVADITQHCLDILNEMSADGVQYASYNVDIAFRILKETMNMEGFKSIMRHAYGIDLDYPDRPPLEYWSKAAVVPAAAEDGPGVIPSLPTQLPFSVAAFNTALDFLGAAGDVSKLVQTFEVVTNPLPSSISNPAFQDDDDEDFGVSNPQVAPYKAPYVKPNTTSFRLLLKGVSEANHFVLARHYLLAAIEYEREQNRQLREWTRIRSPEDIPSPHVATNRALFLPVFHMFNRARKVEMLRWTLVRVKRSIRRKRYDIEHYEAVRARWIESGVYRQTRSVEDDLNDESGADLPLPSTSSRFSTFFSPSSSASQPTSSDLKINMDEPLVPVEGEKKFDIDRHLTVIQRDLEELEGFEKRVEDVLGRTTQRIKERLGRRVWAGKTVYLHELDTRTTLDPEEWRGKVNFRTQAEIEAARMGGRKADVRERPSAGADGHRIFVERDQPPHKSLGV